MEIQNFIFLSSAMTTVTALFGIAWILRDRYHNRRQGEIRAEMDALRSQFQRQIDALRAEIREERLTRWDAPRKRA